MYKACDSVKSNRLSPERTLYAAIILRAWADLEWLDESIRNHAWAWIHEEEYKNKPTTGETSFKSCCLILGLDPKTMKRIVTTRSYTASTADKRSGTYRDIKKIVEGIRLS